MDYRKFLTRHFETDADITVSVIPIPPDSASEFGLVKIDNAGRIVEFREKPKGDALEAMRVDTASLGLSADDASKRPYLASMGIYVFKYDRLEEVLAEDTSHLDFGKEVIPSSINKYNVQAISSTTIGKTSERSRLSTKLIST
jgi:glucose-1-phosphate adenylyltransferase